MIKKILKLALFIFLLFAPFVSVVLYVEKQENQYKNTYLAELPDKINLLENTREKKIVFVGGSSLPFGVRSDLIEKELEDYKVVNFGLYATLGTKLMMDLSKININEGDIIVLSPELNQQTYSLYFNAEAVLQALDGFSFKQKYLSIEDNLSLIYKYMDFSRQKMEYKRNDSAPDPIGIYRHDSFNKYGDIEVDRPNNIMNNGYDSTMNIVLNEKLLDQQFLDYVNDYCNYVRKQGAKIYFNFSPCNELAIKTSKEKRRLFQESLDNSIECDLLSNIEECIMNSNYFYDTNFHLNSSGAIYYTSILIKNLKRVLGISSNMVEDPNQPNPPIGGIEIPEPPAPGGDVVEDPINKDFDAYDGSANDLFVDYFEYKLVGTSYQIIGVKDIYKDIERVILPSSYNGRNVTAVTTDCLYGCINLKEIFIGKTYKVFEEGSFNGCISLGKIYLFEKDGNLLSPASSGLLDGAGKNVRIYIPEGSNYVNGYTWSNYTSYFVYF